MGRVKGGVVKQDSHKRVGSTRVWSQVGRSEEHNRFGRIDREVPVDGQEEVVSSGRVALTGVSGYKQFLRRTSPHSKIQLTKMMQYLEYYTHHKSTTSND